MTRVQPKAHGPWLTPKAPDDEFVWVRETKIRSARQQQGSRRPALGHEVPDQAQLPAAGLERAGHPGGVNRVVHDFLSRAEEIAYLARTQHDADPSTYLEFKAMGIESQDFSSYGVDSEAANLAESHVGFTPTCVILPNGEVGDRVYIANQSRRIDWERYTDACGPVKRAYFEPMASGETGIGLSTATYGRKTKPDPEADLALRRKVKASWLAEHDDLPMADDIVAIKQTLKGTKVIDRGDDIREALRGLTRLRRERGRRPVAPPVPRGLRPQARPLQVQSVGRGRA